MTDVQPTGRALVLVAAPAREAVRSQLLSHHLDCDFVDDPYQALATLVARPLAFRAVVVSLQILYRSELMLIKVIRERLPHLEVILTHTDGRAAALAEAMRLGATELLGDDGLHRLIEPPSSCEGQEPDAGDLTSQLDRLDPNADDPIDIRPTDLDGENHFGEPILTADELRALLHDSKVDE